jgi:hypothetical protein
MVGWWEASAPGTPATMTVLAANAADVSHMPSIPAYGKPTFACNLALLLRAHRGKPTPTLLPPIRSGFRSSAAHRLTATVGGPARLSPAAVAPALRGAATRLVAFTIVFLHSTTAAARSTASGALTIGLFGMHARRLLSVVRALARASPTASGFCDGESALPVASTRV